VLSPVTASASLLRATDAAAVKPVFEEELSLAWGRPAPIGDFFIPRVDARGGGRFLIQYRFSTAGKSWIFWGRIGFESTGGDEGPTFSIRELGLVVPIFPFDPDLPALARFFPPGESAGPLESLREALDLTTGARIEDVLVLGYRLGRRAVLRCRLRDGGRELTVVAKLLPARKAARLAHLMRALARSGFDGSGADVIRVPRILAESAEGILWLEAFPEPSLHDLIGQPSFVPGAAAAARALRRLHAIATLDLSPLGAGDELARLRQTLVETTDVFPHLATGLREVMGLLEAGVPGPSPSAATLHRDFYDKQVLTGAGGTTLLDADTLAAGDPALDVGNFLAHLVVRARQEPGSAAVLAEGRAAFLADYGDVGEARWRWWEAASLLRLSCVYSLRPRWRALAVPLLEESRKRLRSGGGSHA